MDFTAKVGESGRLVIPAALRKALGLKTGDDVVMRIEDDELRVLTVDQAVARAQARVRRYAAGQGSLSDRLIEERRFEAAREAREAGGP